MNAKTLVKIPLRAAYGYDTDAASDASGIDCSGPSPTVQDQKEDADINEIVRRFGLTGELPISGRVPLPAGVDISDLPNDYASALALVDAAEDSFMSLPASVRAKHGGDPAAFLDWVASASADELKALLPSAPADASGGPAPAAATAPPS